MSIFFNSKPKKIIHRESKKSTKLEWEKDESVRLEMEKIIVTLGMEHIVVDKVFCYRTTGSKAKAYARIWSFPKIFQKALSLEPSYVLEIISERYDRLNREEKTKVIIHELLHIPKNFSGSLLPHKYGHTLIDREVESLYKKYRDNI